MRQGQDRIDRMLEDVWQRVQGTGAKPAAWDAAQPLVSIERELMEEAVSRMRARLSQERSRVRRFLEEKDERIAQLKEDKLRAERALEELRAVWQAERERNETQAEILSIEKAEWEANLKRQTRWFQGEVEAYDQQLRTLEDARREEARRYDAGLARWREEEKGWGGLLDRKEGEITELKARINDLTYQVDAARSRGEEERRRLEAQHKASTAGLQEELQNLKNRLDFKTAEADNLQRFLTLAQEEIAQFTRDKHALESELKASQEQVGRLQTELRSLRDSWEVERAHWRELWERERSSRETWYDHMREWEDHLRAEREAWLTQFQAETLRVRAERGAPAVAPALTEAVGEEPRPALLERWAETLQESDAVRRLFRPRVLAPAVAAGLIAISAVLFLRGGPDVHQAPTSHAAALTVRGREIFFADWMSGQILMSSTARPADLRAAGAPSLDFHPVALSLSADGLWSLDSWSRLVAEHRAVAPFERLRSWGLSLAAPVDIAWDGQGLWVLNRNDQTLRRYPAGRFDSPDRQVALPKEWTLSALDAHRGELWGYDAAARRLRRFKPAAKAVPVASYRLRVHEEADAPLSDLRVSEDAVWTLSEKSRTAYRWPRRKLAIRAFVAKAFFQD